MARWKSFWVWLALVASLGLGWAQRLRAVFGLFEGNASGSGTISPHFYELRIEPGGSRGQLLFGLSSNQGDVEPYGTDLAYDTRTKFLFLIGGGPTPTTWYGSVYGLDVWRSLVSISLLPRIGARRLAVWDSFLLVTRTREPYLTAYKITYQEATQSVRLDSAWSVTHPLLRGIPEGIVLIRDTAYLSISARPSDNQADSLVVAINLRSRSVLRAWEVYRRPEEIFRIGNFLYVSCPSDPPDNWRIVRIDPQTITVQRINTGYRRECAPTGIATDVVRQRDSLIFWDQFDSVRVMNTSTMQVAPAAFRGFGFRAPGLNGYSLFWAGDMIFFGLTNRRDTSLLIIYDPPYIPTPPHLDTAFIRNGEGGGIDVPSLRRLIYVEDDTTRQGPSQSLAVASQDSRLRAWVAPGTEWLSWESPVALTELRLYDLQGRLLRQWGGGPLACYVGDLSSGCYLLWGRSIRGEILTTRFWKE
ncbi:MAG: hypothetical protein NZ958_07445 [Bacteroidia bacterium]|nr:hypothetical protein [Bacteroidia bacterium]MDW8088682.1 hypothetical protein [Bacteroidia bacterium]